MSFAERRTTQQSFNVTLRISQDRSAALLLLQYTVVATDTVRKPQKTLTDGWSLKRVIWFVVLYSTVSVIAVTSSFSVLTLAMSQSQRPLTACSRYRQNSAILSASSAAVNHLRFSARNDKSLVFFRKCEKLFTCKSVNVGTRLDRR